MVGLLKTVTLNLDVHNWCMVEFCQYPSPKPEDESGLVRQQKGDLLKERTSSFGWGVHKFLVIQCIYHTVFWSSCSSIHLMVRMKAGSDSWICVVSRVSPWHRLCAMHALAFCAPCTVHTVKTFQGSICIEILSRFGGLAAQTSTTITYIVSGPPVRLLLPLFPICHLNLFFSGMELHCRK